LPQFLNTQDANFEAVFQGLLSAKREESPDVDAVVSDIIADVRARGDRAVLELTAKFDRLTLHEYGPITNGKCPKMHVGPMTPGQR